VRIWSTFILISPVPLSLRVSDGCSWSTCPAATLQLRDTLCQRLLGPRTSILQLLDGWTRSGHYSARDHVRDTTLVISRCCLFNFKLNNDHSTGILSAMVCSVERGKGKGLGVLRVHLHLHLHLSARHTPSNSRVRLACS